MGHGKGEEKRVVIYAQIASIDKGQNPEAQLLALRDYAAQQRWQEHFTWDERFKLIIGLKATGRATVAALQLNRPELMHLRRLLCAASEHPIRAAEGQASS